MTTSPAGRLPLARRAAAEAAGTAALVAVVVGSGIAAARLSPGDVGLQLLESSLATALGLLAIIFTLGPVSGAHLNPVVSLVDRLLGGLSTRELGAYVAAQMGGGVAGCVLANLMFELPAVHLSVHDRGSGGVWLAEIVATAGLLVVVASAVRTGRAAAAPVAVATYIGAAYWFTSSTSFANPAVTVARAFSDTFAGIAPSSVPLFVLCQLAGAGAALVAIRAWFPDRAPSPSPADPAPLQEELT